MTNSERITANNTRLSALVETAESLPDAGSGGGGVETCTVTINTVGLDVVAITITKMVDGKITTYFENYPDNLTFENVVCGSAISILTDMWSVPGYEISGGGQYMGVANSRLWAFSASESANANCVITVREDD